MATDGEVMGAGWRDVPDGEGWFWFASDVLSLRVREVFRADGRLCASYGGSAIPVDALPNARWFRIAPPPVTPPACGTTHHLGCACHEAAHRARVEALEAEVARLRRSPASATLSAHDHVRELVAERDEARARAAEHHRRGDEARHEAAGLRRRVAELEAETAQAMAKRDTAMRERIDARADFAASEECLADIVRVWMDADGTRQSEAALAIPMLRMAIEAARKGRTGEWWKR